MQQRKGLDMGDGEKERRIEKLIDDLRLEK